jgi:ATP-binding cassette subfamily F protein 3
MFYVNGVNLKFGDRNLLKNVDFMLTKKDRTGLIGKNGAGKSTLFKIIDGQITPDSGTIQYPNGFSIGLLKQDLDFDLNKTVIQETKLAFERVETLKDDLQKTTQLLSDREDYQSDEYMEMVNHLTEINHQLDILGAEQIEAECEKVLKGLGFKDEDFEKKIGTFSGGWQMRVELAKLLLTNPDLLMLDEPTNHLDIESIIWLEEYLKSYPGIVLIISHDIQFLNNVCNKVIELELGKSTLYVGNYDKFKERKAAQREILIAAYNNQQKEIAVKEKTIARFMAKATKTSMAQSMQKQLDKVERIEIPEEDNKKFNLNFGQAPRSGRVVMDIQHVDMSYGPKKVLSDLSIYIERGDKVAFVGQNGQGKSTLAKLVVGDLNPSNGKIEWGANVYLSYYAQNQSETLDTSNTVLGLMEDLSPAEQRSNIRNILGAFLFSGEDAEKKISVLSGGERARLALAIMILKQSNLIIMDEPTNHLDIISKNVLKDALLRFHGTLIVVSHDRDFLAGLTNKVYEFKNQNITEYLGDINYFLEKKKMDDMREIQTLKNKHKLATKIETGNEGIDRKEQKQLKRRLQYVERDMEKVESKMKEIEQMMLDPAFYQNPEFEQKNQTYLNLKEKHEHLNLEWEELAEKIIE